MYEILEKIKFENRIPQSLKYITQAGGKLSNELFNKIVFLSEKKNLDFISMYGQTEATSRMSYLQWKFAKNKIGSIGKPLNGGNFYIIDKNSKKIEEANKSGQLIYKGENVSLGYAENISDLSLGDLNKGKLFTGDLAYKDNEGFYYISGRLKRISKVFGLRINLDELEILIKNWGYEIAITSNDKKIFCFFSKNIQEESMIEEISKNIGIHKKAIKIKILKKIPRNSSGKVIYRELSIYDQ
jgi:acyl-coenzyme A synthetase/AMP-(fatty) acid ligase